MLKASSVHMHMPSLMSVLTQREFIEKERR